jgi:hypothetical protein
MGGVGCVIILCAVLLGIRFFFTGYKELRVHHNGMGDAILIATVVATVVVFHCEAATSKHPFVMYSTEIAMFLYWAQRHREHTQDHSSVVLLLSGGAILCCSYSSLFSIEVAVLLGAVALVGTAAPSVVICCASASPASLAFIN